MIFESLFSPHVMFIWGALPCTCDTILMWGDSYTAWPEHPFPGMGGKRVGVLGLCAHLHARGWWPLPQERVLCVPCILGEGALASWRLSPPRALVSIDSESLVIMEERTPVYFHSICSKSVYQEQSSDPYGHSRLQESSRLFPKLIV